MGWFMDIMRKATGHLNEDALIDLALDGLQGAAKDRAEAHLRECAMCRNDLRRWMDLHGLFSALAPQVPAPTGLESRILGSLKPKLSEQA